MRHIVLLLTLAAIAYLIPSARAREIEDLRERVRDGVQRTDKDLGNYVHRDRLNEQQRGRFDSAVKDLQAVSEAVAGGKWQEERSRLERAVDNIEFLQKNAPIEEKDRTVLGIDVYTLRVILDNWKP